MEHDRHSDLENVQRFASALDLALHDSELENSGHNIEFFFDADAVIDVIVGLTAWDPSRPLPKIDSWDYVTRALISTGYVPRARLLRPHLVEFDRFVGRIPKPSKDSAGNSRHTSLRYLVGQWQLAEYDSELEEYPDTVGGLGEFIRRVGFEVFVKLELCYGGSAFDRFIRICRQIDLSGIPELPPVRRNDELADRMTALVTNLRPVPKSNKKVAISNRVDGYALADLSRLISQQRAVRFFSHTKALWSLSHLDEFADSTGRTIFRSRDYFVMRCSFRSLGFQQLVREAEIYRGDSLGEITIEHFAQIRDILFEILEESNGDPSGHTSIEVALASTDAKSLRIPEIIDSFKRLRFLSEVVLRWPPPTPMLDFMPFLKARLGSSELVKATRDSLSESHQAISRALDETVGHLRDWRRDYIKIQRSIEKVRGEWEVEPDPWKDLGLGRWGLQVTLSEPARTRLIAWIDSVYSDEVNEQKLADFALLVAAKEYETEDDLSVAICVLWSLKLFDFVVREWEEVSEELRSKVPVGLEILYLVCKIKGIHRREGKRKAEALKEISAAVDASKAFVDRLIGDSDLNVAAAQMCDAHVTYWAWARAAELKTKELARDLAERSYKAAVTAVEFLDPGSLMWAFGVNHAAYICIRAGVEHQKKSYWMGQLAEVNEYHDHYRFGDTRAWAFTELALKIIRDLPEDKASKEPQSVEYRKRACENLENAYRRLLEAKPWFGDIEVKRHRELIEDQRAIIECSMLPVA